MTLLLSIEVHASTWYAPFCEQNCESPTCNELQSTGVDNVIPTEILAYGEIIKGADEIESSIQAQIDQWGDFTRWLKGDPLKGSADGLDQRWSDLQEEARALLEIHNQLNINKRRLDVCYRAQCSPMRRLELEDERDLLNKIKIKMTALSPWWLSEEFLEQTEKVNPTEISEQQLKKIFISSMTNFFQQSFDLRSQVGSIKAHVQLTMAGQEPASVLVTTLGTRYNEAFDLILKRRLLHKTEHLNPLCDMAKTKEKFDKARNYATGTFKGGLLISSLLVGPQSLLLTSAAKSLASRGLFTRVANFFSSGPRTLAYGADAVLTAGIISDRLDKAQQCQRILALNQLGDENEDSWQQCLREKEQASLVAMLATVGTTSTFALPLVRSLLRARATPPAITSKAASEGNTLTTLDLTRQREIASSELSNLSGEYWNFVGNVYRDRLNLTAEEIAGFVASSKAFENRTKLVVMTRGPPSTNSFQGGVAMVESTKASDLLPLEKATGINRLGIPSKQVGNPIERDVVLEIDAADFARALLNVN